MDEKLTIFDKKILDFLKGHYNQQFSIGKQTKIETKRLSKAKNDIIARITNSMNAFAMLSEIIRISNTTPNRAQSSNDEIKYIRENYSNLPGNIIRSTLSFDLVGEEYILQHFKGMQRDLAKDVFSLGKMQSLLDAIFVFHPQAVLSQSVGDSMRYRSTKEIDEHQYKDSHKKYYRDMAGMLVECGIREIKKNLHPENDKSLINNLDFTVNMIKRLDYHVEKIEQEKTDQ